MANTLDNKQLNRRQVVKTVALGSAWMTPVITSVVLPAHAQTSPTETTTTMAPACVANVIEMDSLSEPGVTWARLMTIPQYNGPGTLSQVIIRFFCQAPTEVGIENRDMTAQDYTTNLNVTVATTGAANLSLPLTATRTDSLGPVDRVIDFGGTAGISFDLASGEQIQTTTLPPSGFVGTGTVTFNTTAGGSANIKGSSSSVRSLLTFAQARIEVEYVCA